MFRNLVFNALLVLSLTACSLTPDPYGVPTGDRLTDTAIAGFGGAAAGGLWSLLDNDIDGIKTGGLLGGIGAGTVWLAYGLQAKKEGGLSNGKPYVVREPVLYQYDLMEIEAQRLKAQQEMERHHSGDATLYDATPPSAGDPPYYQGSTGF